MKEKLSYDNFKTKMSSFSTYIPTVEQLKEQADSERKAEILAEDNKKSVAIMKDIKNQMKQGGSELRLITTQIPSARKAFAQILEERGFHVSAWIIFESQTTPIEDPKSSWTISWK